MPDTWPEGPNRISTSADRNYKCLGCGTFCSTRYCWNCSTNPLMEKFTEITQANERANAIISQQADEAKNLQDKIDALTNKIKEYLSFSSIDGKYERQALRKELGEMIK